MSPNPVAASRVLYALFVVSGAAGLMYESIWSRYLGLFVGHGAYAQILVLVIFLGGMSLGAHLVGRRSERVRDPLVWYARVELLVALIGLVFHAVFVGATELAYDALFPRLPGGAVLVAKWVLAGALILPQSVLLGATFPLMSAGAIRRSPGEPGRVLALLYFANSLGAAAGVLLAGFVLLAWVGLPGTLEVAAACNVAVAVGAYLVARLAPVAGEAPAPAPADALPATSDATPATPTGRRASPLTRALLLVAFGTAAASFVYEVAWIRMLSLVVGSATHSFETMLAAFILGLALGAFWVRRRADRFADPVRALALTQCVMGALAIATLPVYAATFHLMAGLLDALDLTESGYRVFTVARFALCLAVMLPATFCAGITLPLITRVLVVHGEGEGAIGRVYAVNTLGSIVGAALAGLVLMPLVGLKWLLVGGAMVDVALGLALLGGWGRERVEPERAGPERVEPEREGRARVGRLGWGGGGNGGGGYGGEERTGRGRRVRWAERVGGNGEGGVPVAGVFVAGLLGVAALTPLDHAVLTSGVYRYAAVTEPGTYAVPFYRDGRTATVSVRRHQRSQMVTLATNGKPDASLSSEWIGAGRDTTPAALAAVRARRPLTGDQVTQALLPLLALAHAPRAGSAAVIGQGSGMTSHLLLGSPHLRDVATIDIEPEMIRGSRHFYPGNRRVFDDPRSHFVTDDAKAYFASAHRTFDVILSEPSNPWVSGVSGLFTDEFYARVKGYLAPGGVFGQWLHLYEIDDRLVLSVLAAVHRHFPAYTVYMASRADIFVVATTGAAVPTPDWRVVDYPGVARDLARTPPLDAETLGGLRLADRAALAPLLDRWRPVNSDFHPVLDLGAERTRFLKRSARGFRELHLGRFDPVAGMRGWRVDFAESPTAAMEMPRAESRARAAAIRLAWQSYAPDGVPGDGGEAPFLPLGARRRARCATRSTAAPRSSRRSPRAARRPTGTTSCATRSTSRTTCTPAPPGWSTRRSTGTWSATSTARGRRARPSRRCASRAGSPGTTGRWRARRRGCWCRRSGARTRGCTRSCCTTARWWRRCAWATRRSRASCSPRRPAAPRVRRRSCACCCWPRGSWRAGGARRPIPGDRRPVIGDL
jgi:predicted membrane-bound spermidine synthase